MTSVYLDILIILSGGIALWWGATQIVTGAGHLARRLGISDLVIGLTIVAFGTSMPEFAVTVIAALRDHGDISIGNVAGSNIINFGFVLGFVAIIKAIETTHRLVKRDGLVLIAATVMLLLFLLDDRLARWEGLLFIVLLSAYNIYLLRGHRINGYPDAAGDFKIIDIGRLLLGIILVGAGGQFLVESAIDIARLLKISEWVIGQTLVAFGTSLPELATSVAAILKGRHGLSAGNLVGSNIFNILGVLGLSSIIRPMTIGANVITNIYILIGFTLLVVLLLRSDGRLSRVEGILLFAINLAIWLFAFNLF